MIQAGSQSAVNRTKRDVFLHVLQVDVLQRVALYPVRKASQDIILTRDGDQINRRLTSGPNSGRCRAFVVIMHLRTRGRLGISRLSLIDHDRWLVAIVVIGAVVAGIVIIVVVVTRIVIRIAPVTSPQSVIGIAVKASIAQAVSIAIPSEARMAVPAPKTTMPSAPNAAVTTAKPATGRAMETAACETVKSAACGAVETTPDMSSAAYMAATAVTAAATTGRKRNNGQDTYQKVLRDIFHDTNPELELNAAKIRKQGRVRGLPAELTPRGVVCRDTQRSQP